MKNKNSRIKNMIIKNPIELPRVEAVVISRDTKSIINLYARKKDSHLVYEIIFDEVFRFL